MKTRSNRLNNGYSNFNLSDRVDGIISTQKTFLNSSDCFEALEGQYPYRRPAEWIAMPGITSGQQIFIGTAAIYNNGSNFIALRATTSTGNYLVNWGNGTTSSHASNALAQKQYTEADFSGLTSATYDGYKTLNITVTPVTGNITSFSLNEVNTTPAFNPAAYSAKPWLDVKMRLPNATSVSVANCFLLEQFELIDSNSLNTCSSMFQNCYNLQRVHWFNASNVTNVGSMFSGCFNLLEIPPLDTGKATQWYAFCQNAFSLRYVPYLNTRSAITFAWTFIGCTSLKSIPSFNLQNATEMYNTFDGCHSLEYVPFMNTPNCTRFDGCFNGCSSLRKVAKFDTSKATNMQSMFSACRNLKTVPFFNTSSATNMASMFSGCFSLSYVPDFNTQNVTSVDNMFRSCYSLKKGPNFNTQNCTNFNQFFWSCHALKTVPNYNLQKGTVFTNMFDGCYSLKEIPITYVGPTAGTTLATNAFNSMFSSCSSLVGLSFWNFSAATGASYANVFTNIFNNMFTIRSLGFTGISQNISVDNKLIGATALNDLYTSLAVVGASGSGTKTITVTNSWGAAADNPNIAIEKGWSVSG